MIIPARLAGERSDQAAVTPRGGTRPFNEEQLWKKLAQVTAVHGRLLTPALIEKIFNIKLKELPEYPKNVGRLFGIRAQIDWYYGIGVHIYKDENLFTFGLGKASDEHFCISGNMVSNTLEEQGWKLHYPPHLHRFVDAREYSFESTKLTVEFSEPNGCLADLIVSSYNAN